MSRNSLIPFNLRFTRLELEVIDFYKLDVLL